MKRTSYFLVAIAAAGMVLLGTIAQANTISVNFTPVAGADPKDLVPSDVAGVVAVGNWNNAKGASGTIGSLANDSGAGTGVGLTFLGSSLTNNPRKTTGGLTGDQKMMYWSADTCNESSVQNWWDGSGGGGGAQYHQQLLNTSGFGPATTKASFTNLNAVFPNGYSVYVYVKGTSPGYNAQTGAGGYNEANARNAANPVEVLVGGAGLYATIDVAYNNRYHFGANGPATQTKAGLSASVVSNPALAALSTQRGVAWPTTLIDLDRRIADFDGTYIQAPLGAVDAMPLDWGQMSDNSPIYTPPGPGADYPLNAEWAGKSGQFSALPGDGFQDPITRNIPVGNYLVFENLNLNNLEVLSRNLAGMRVLGAGSTSQIEMGGISGIQIVGVVPEPSTLALLGIAAMGLVGYIWRRKR